MNLQLSGVDTVLGRLIVAPGLGGSLNIHGLDGGGSIDDVGLVADNINIDGDSPVSIGSFSSFAFQDPTRPTGGTIDAHTDMGGVTVFMQAGPTATGLPAQTFIGGPGGGTVHLQGFGGTNVDFSIAGPDTVQFDSEANYTSTHPILDATHQYNQVLGFTAANATLNVTNSSALGEFGAVNFTDGSGVVPSGAAAPPTDTFTFNTDTALADAAIDPFNFIKIDSPVAATTGSTVQGAFNEAMGVAGSILVNGSHEFLASFYDSTTSQAVVETVHSTAALGGLIAAGDHVSVVALVHMSAADYATFTPHFV